MAKKQHTYFRPHELALWFPRPNMGDYQALKDSIAHHGIQEPVVVLDEQVLDGLTRTDIAQELGIECPYILFDHSKGLTPLEYVLDQNLRRRHLTPMQIAALSEKLLIQRAEETQERMASEMRGNQRAAKNNFDARVKIVSETAAAQKTAIEEVAEELGIPVKNVRTVVAARKLDMDAELSAARSGELSGRGLTQAVAEKRAKLAEDVDPVKASADRLAAAKNSVRVDLVRSKSFLSAATNAAHSLDLSPEYLSKLDAALELITSLSELPVE